MKNSVYSTFDFVTELFSQPWISPNDKCAVRAFAYAVNDPDFIISKSPQDFALFKIGTFDDHTGEIVSINPAIVAKALDVFDAEAVAAIRKFGKDYITMSVREDKSNSSSCSSKENQGAAVGGESPLKQQSEIHGVSEMDASKNLAACEVSETPSSKANEKE